MKTFLSRKLFLTPLLFSLLILVLSLKDVAASPHRPCCGGITAAGQRLAEFIDGMNVESLWIAHEHVNWETGEPDRGAAYEAGQSHTLQRVCSGGRKATGGLHTATT
jgi:hypothetical protein